MHQRNKKQTLDTCNNSRIHVASSAESPNQRQQCSWSPNILCNLCSRLTPVALPRAGLSPELGLRDELFSPVGSPGARAGVRPAAAGCERAVDVIQVCQPHHTTRNLSRSNHIICVYITVLQRHGYWCKSRCCPFRRLHKPEPKFDTLKNKVLGFCRLAVSN